MAAVRILHSGPIPVTAQIEDVGFECANGIRISVHQSLAGDISIDEPYEKTSEIKGTNRGLGVVPTGWEPGSLKLEIFSRWLKHPVAGSVVLRDVLTQRNGGSAYTTFKHIPTEDGLGYDITDGRCFKWYRLYRTTDENNNPLRLLQTAYVIMGAMPETVGAENSKITLDMAIPALPGMVVVERVDGAA